MTKSHCEWTHDDFIKDGMVQVFDVTRCRHYYRLNDTPLCRKRVRLTFTDCTCVPDCQNEKLKKGEAVYYCRWYQKKQIRTTKTDSRVRTMSGSSLSDPFRRSAEGF
jgi:hypothetical protein